MIAVERTKKEPIFDADLQPSGSRSGSKDPEHIKKLWTRFPDANVAICTGEISNIVVVDLDSEDVMEELAENQLSVPTNAYRVKSPRGFHIYLDWDTHKDLKQTVNLVKHMDIRSDGGYIISWPSKIGDKSYELAHDGPIGKWPELVEFSKQNKRTIAPSTNGRTPAMPNISQPDWVTTALTGVGEGERNYMASRLAGFFHSKRLGEDITRQLLESFRLNCTPPLDSLEIDTTVRSIYRNYVITDQYGNDNEEIEPPIVDSTIANRRIFRYDSDDLICTLSRIYSSRSGIDCWIKISSSSKPVYGPMRLNLLSSSARDSLIRQLNRRMEKNWLLILDQIASLVADSLDEAGDNYDMRTYTPKSTTENWCIRPYLMEAAPSLFYGNGGEGKSSLVYALLLSKASGRALLPGIEVSAPGPVLMCDWEDNSDTFFKTCTALLTGAGMTWADVIYGVHYRKLIGPLVDHIDRLQADIARDGVELVAIDSITAAANTDVNDADSARVWFQSVMSLGTSTVSITHVAKNGNREGTPFGSVYYWNFSRAVFDVARGESQSEKGGGGTDSLLAVTHKKGNRTGLLKPIGYTVKFVNDEDGQATSISYSEGDLSVSETLSSKLSTTDRILAIIQQVSMSPNEIAEELGLRPNTVSQALLRAKQRGWVTINAAGQYRVITEE